LTATDSDPARMPADVTGTPPGEAETPLGAAGTPPGQADPPLDAAATPADAAGTTVPGSGTSGLLAGRYQLGGLLGQGGMADVYQAEDRTDGSAVAVKLVRSTDVTVARRLTQEARALRRLRHPALVGLRDAGVSNGRAFLVMDLVDGMTLSERLRSGALDTPATADLAVTLSGALAYVHEHGIVHRDVKPGNIMLGADGRPRLTDFGIASMADNSMLTMTGTTLGTAAYMAPEQLEHHQVGPEADVWSLAMVLLECLLGRRVYEGNAIEVVSRRLSGPIPIPDDLPTPWRLLLAGMFDHDPGRRPTAADVHAMAGAPAFAAPWVRRSIPPGHGRPDTPAVPAAGALPGEATILLPATPDSPDIAALPETVAMGAFADHDLTALRDVDPTAIAAPAAIRPAPASGDPTRRRWVLLATAGAAAALVVALALLFATAGSPPKTRTSDTHHTSSKLTGTSSGASSASKSAGSSGTTSSASTGSSTGQPSTTSAATSLLSAVGGDALSGGLSAGQASAIGKDVSAALIDIVTGDQTAASNNLDAIDAIIADAAGSTLSSSETATLTTDLSNLAAAAGLPAPVAPAATPNPTSPAGASGPGGAPGPGNQGNGPQNGGPGKQKH